MKLYSVYFPSILLKIRNLILQTNNPTSPTEALDLVLIRVKNKLDEVNSDYSSIKNNTAHWDTLFSKYITSNEPELLRFTALKIEAVEELTKTKQLLEEVYEAIISLKDGTPNTKAEFDILKEYILNTVVRVVSIGIITLDSGDKMDLEEVFMKELNSLEKNLSYSPLVMSYKK